jgi:hypothetical protein
MTADEIRAAGKMLRDRVTRTTTRDNVDGALMYQNHQACASWEIAAQLAELNTNLKRAFNINDKEGGYSLSKLRVDILE